jgi:hypothetical protein
MDRLTCRHLSASERTEALVLGSCYLLLGTGYSENRKFIHRRFPESKSEKRVWVKWVGDGLNFKLSPFTFTLSPYNPLGLAARSW